MANVKVCDDEGDAPFLKVFSHPQLGGDRKILLDLYRSLVRSKLDYGCFIYGSAKPSHIRMLDPIHHQGLRLALGAFRTSPVESLLAEANELPLNLRRKKLGLQYFFKIKSTPDNPVSEHLLDIPDRAIALFERNPKRTPPFGLRVLKDLEHLEIPNLNIAEFSFPDSPPWLLSRPAVDLTLSAHKKEQTTPKKFRNRLLPQ